MYVTSYPIEYFNFIASILFLLYNAHFIVNGHDFFLNCIKISVKIFSYSCPEGERNLAISDCK